MEDMNYVIIVQIFMVEKPTQSHKPLPVGMDKQWKLK